MVTAAEHPNPSPGTPRLWCQLLTSLIWLYRGPIVPHGEGYRPDPLGSTAWLVLKGNAQVTIEGCRVSAGPGQWLFPKPIARTQNFSPNTEILSLRYHAEWPDGQQLFDQGLSVTFKETKYPELRRCAEKLQRMVCRVSHRSFNDISFACTPLSLPHYFQIEQALMNWMQTMYHCLTSEGLTPHLRHFEDQRMTLALDLLNGWPLNQRYTNTLLARQVGLSRSQLERLFAHHLGATTKHYLDRRRLRQAQLALYSQNKQVKELAYELGFRHVSSFSAWLKDKTGRAPRDFKDGLLL